MTAKPSHSHDAQASEGGTHVDEARLLPRSTELRLVRHGLNFPTNPQKAKRSKLPHSKTKPPPSQILCRSGLSSGNPTQRSTSESSSRRAQTSVSTSQT